MNKTQFGSSREDLSKRATVYASGLFTGKTVVVTGAGGGLGLAIATLFARLGPIWRSMDVTKRSWPWPGSSSRVSAAEFSLCP